MSYPGGHDQFNPGPLNIPDPRPPEAIVATLVAGAGALGVNVRAALLPDPLPAGRAVTRWYPEGGVERAEVKSKEHLETIGALATWEETAADGIRAFVFGTAASVNQGPHVGGRLQECWQVGFRAAQAALADQDDPRYGSTTDLCHRAALKVGVDPEAVQPSRETLKVSTPEGDEEQSFPRTLAGYIDAIVYQKGNIRRWIHDGKRHHNWEVFIGCDTSEEREKTATRLLALTH